MNAIYLLPVGSLLFALWYFEGVRGILKIKYCAKTMESLRWFTYFTILFTYCGFVILCILNPARTNSYDPGVLDYEVVIPVCVLGELAVVFLAFSIFKINRFFRELSQGSDLFLNNGKPVNKELKINRLLAAVHVTCVFVMVPVIVYENKFLASMKFALKNNC